MKVIVPSLNVTNHKLNHFEPYHNRVRPRFLPYHQRYMPLFVISFHASLAVRYSEPRDKGDILNIQ